MNERTRTIALLATVVWLLAAIGELTEGILHTLLMELLHPNAWLQHSSFAPVSPSYSKSSFTLLKFDKYPAMLHKTSSSKLRVKLADCHRARSK